MTVCINRHEAIKHLVTNTTLVRYSASQTASETSVAIGTYGRKTASEKSISIGTSRTAGLCYIASETNISW